MRLTTHLPAGGRIASTAQLSLKTCPRFLELRRLLFVSDAASPKHRAKESTTKCPPRDIHPQRRMRPHARASLLPKRSVAAQRKCRKFGPKPTAQKRRYHCNINYLVAGWGARIRTWEWRNSSVHRLARKPLRSHPLKQAPQPFLDQRTRCQRFTVSSAKQEVAATETVISLHAPPSNAAAPQPHLRS
jgi:hypothetical protein